MPWHIEKGGGTCSPDEYAVIKDSDGSTAGCHDTREEAEAQMAALYAKEPQMSAYAEVVAQHGRANGDCGCVEERDHFTQRASVDNSGWDGDAAMARCSNSDTPASCFNSICAARVSANPADTQAGWALPHHKNPGSPPNAKGVSSALGYLDRTQGINKDAARRHLKRHQSAIQAQNNSASPAELRQQRHGTIPADTARRLAFPTQFHSERVTLEGLEFVHLRGIATVYERPYEMWDAFGTYNEVVSLGAGAVSLTKKPNVMFLLNHAGSPMARTVNEKRPMDLREEPDGLHVDAWVNPNRGDVRDMVIGIDDGDITDMSFAFLITKGAWNDDYTEFRIQEYDIDGGDVSVVAKGANPYTSVGARAQEIMADLDLLPVGAQRAAFMRLQRHLPDLDQRDRQTPPAEEHPAEQPPVARPTGASVNLVRARLALMDNTRP